MPTCEPIIFYLTSLVGSEFFRSGCSLCHLAYFPCQDSSDFFSSRPPMFNLQTPPYPSNIDEILAGCEERANWWSKNIQTLGERHWPCDRHNSFQLVAITGDCGDRENETSNVQSYELFDQTWVFDESCSESRSSDLGSQ